MFTTPTRARWAVGLLALALLTTACNSGRRGALSPATTAADTPPTSIAAPDPTVTTEPPSFALALLAAAGPLGQAYVPATDADALASLQAECTAMDEMLAAAGVEPGSFLADVEYGGRITDIQREIVLTMVDPEATPADTLGRAAARVAVTKTAVDLLCPQHFAIRSVAPDDFTERLAGLGEALPLSGDRGTILKMDEYLRVTFHVDDVSGVFAESELIDLAERVCTQLDVSREQAAAEAVATGVIDDAQTRLADAGLEPAVVVGDEPTRPAEAEIAASVLLSVATVWWCPGYAPEWDATVGIHPFATRDIASVLFFHHGADPGVEPTPPGATA